MNPFTHSGLPAQGAATLFISPSGRDQSSLQCILSLSNWRLHSANSWEQALAHLRQEPIPVVICDGDLCEGQWRSVLDGIGGFHPVPKVIVATRHATPKLWADVLQSGGYDVLEVPWDRREVFRVMALAWRSWDSAHYCPRTPQGVEILNQEQFYERS